MELEEKIGSFYHYVRKMFGIGLRNMWITKHSTCGDSYYLTLYIIVDIPDDVLKKYERQVKRHYEVESRIMGVNIHTHIVPYLKSLSDEIEAKARCLYKRPDYFKV